MTKRIVAVDDERDILEIVQLAISLDTDWDIATYQSVEDATANPGAADVVLLDHSVAEADVAGCIIQLNDATDSAPVILVTGAQLSSSQVAAFGAAGLIMKPFDVLTIAEQISALLGWASS